LPLTGKKLCTFYPRGRDFLAHLKKCAINKFLGIGVSIAYVFIILYIKEGASGPFFYLEKRPHLPKDELSCKIQGIIPVRRKFFVYNLIKKIC
jgi:hypothetical protein